MRYEKIVKRGGTEILEKIKSASDSQTLLSAILSAVYGCSTEFSGSVLLRSLRSSEGDLRVALMRIVGTFMQMHKTDFLASAFLAEMIRADKIPNAHKAEVADLIEDVIEFKNIFKDKTAD